LIRLTCSRKYSIIDWVYEKVAYSYSYCKKKVAFSLFSLFTLATNAPSIQLSPAPRKRFTEL
jgi:hypothetical protein